MSFLKIHNFEQLFSKYLFSWFGTLFISVDAEILEKILPALTQIGTLFCVQFVLFGFDYARLKFLKERKNRIVKQVNDKIEILEEKLDSEKEKNH